MSVGVDHDTAAFAVNSIRQWWLNVGRARYPHATRLLITADGGGSNGSRVRLWKRELQKLVNELGLDIVVSHLPPGTSKWNKIEHRLFSFISQQPLERRWERFRSAIPSPDLWLVLNDDFRPAASHIRSSPGEADRLAARVRPQSQREQIGKTERSHDVEPVVGFESYADRECCRRKAF